MQSLQAVIGQKREPNFKGCEASIADGATGTVSLKFFFHRNENSCLKANKVCLSRGNCLMSAFTWLAEGIELHDVLWFAYEAVSLGLGSGTKLESASLIAIS